MDVSPQVSVIVAAHASAPWLPGALRSALAQTLGDIEVIVVDDMSPDTTWSVIESFAAADQRIVPIRNERRGGPASARNRGLGIARGRWVAMLDDDDAFLPDRLRRLVAVAEQHQADMVADDMLRRDFDTGEMLGRHLGSDTIMGTPGPLDFRTLIARDMPGGNAGGGRAIGYLKPIFRRAFLERHLLRFDEGVRGSEDLLFYASCVSAGARFWLIDEALYVYAERLNSLSNRYGIARQQALANRRIAALPAAQADPAAAALVARRQARLDRDAVAEEAAAGAWWNALALLRGQRWAEAVANLRIVAGAARRKLLDRQRHAAA